MYEKWKIKKSEIDEKREEYSEVVHWCRENPQYTINDNGEYFEVALKTTPTTEEKESYARSVRDNYLALYVDPYVMNPLRWADLNEKEQEDIVNYRLYLLNIPEQPEFPDIEVKTFEEWLNDDEAA